MIIVKVELDQDTADAIRREAADIRTAAMATTDENVILVSRGGAQRAAIRRRFGREPHGIGAVTTSLFGPLDIESIDFAFDDPREAVLFRLRFAG